MSFSLYDAVGVDKVVINGTEKDLVDASFSDVNDLRPGVSGAVLGENTLEVHDVAGNVTTVPFTLVAPAPAGPHTTTTVTILGGTPATVQVDVVASADSALVKGTAKVTFYNPDGSKKTDKSASLKNGTVQINLPSDFRPGVYTVIAEYRPSSGGAPASTSRPVLWTVT